MMNRLIKNLSKGYQQRVGLAQAMLGKPAVLILDEPTVGLDPKQILDVRDLIRELGQQCAVIFSSHILQEIQAVCARIIVINNGVLIADDTPGNLAGNDRGLAVRVAGPEDEVYAALAALSGVRRVERLGEKENGAFEFLLETEGAVDIRRALFGVLAKNNWPVMALGKNGASLEDIFLRLVAGGTAILPSGGKDES
jgi:ABC-2 type transport system ATP-binding protein